MYMDGERTARSDTAQPSPRCHTLRENVHVPKHALLLRVLDDPCPARQSALSLG